MGSPEVVTLQGRGSPPVLAAWVLVQWPGSSGRAGDRTALVRTSEDGDRKAEVPRPPF